MFGQLEVASPVRGVEAVACELLQNPLPESPPPPLRIHPRPGKRQISRAEELTSRAIQVARVTDISRLAVYRAISRHLPVLAGTRDSTVQQTQSPKSPRRARPTAASLSLPRRRGRLGELVRARGKVNAEYPPHDP